MSEGAVQRFDIFCRAHYDVNGFVVTSLLMLFVFVSTAAAGDGHSP